MIEQSLFQKIRNDLDLWEEPTPWMYLDSEGLVTVGCGTMLPNAAAAKVIPFYHAKTGTAASVTEIEAGWTLLHKGAAVQKAAIAKQKFGARHYEKATDLRITRSTSSSLRDGHVASDYLELKKIYVDFDKFPEDAKLALFDMIYNLGPGSKRTRHHRATGLRNYSLMNAAINGAQWDLAAARCLRHGIKPERNAMTSRLFRSCAPHQSKAPEVPIHAPR